MLKQEFYERAAVIDDINEITDVFNGYWEPLLGMPKFTCDDFQNGLTAPGFDIESSARVVLRRRDNLMVGCILVLDYIYPPVHPFVQGCVRPDFEGQGIGEHLLQWAVKRAGRAVNKVPAQLRVSINLAALSTHEPTRLLFENMEFQPLRHSYVMVAKLEDNLVKPTLPPGIVFSSYKEYPDLASIYRAADEVFQDHRGYISGDEEEGIKQWQYKNDNDPDFDPSLWLLAMNGNEIAAMALCTPAAGTDREMGYVTLLGVRRPWRRKGLALTLLRHAFCEMRHRGLKWAGLTVDAESLTGANRVYERADMKVVRDIVTYKKELRPGIELGK